jgi:hypothetical protein
LTEAIKTKFTIKIKYKNIINKKILGPKIQISLQLQVKQRHKTIHNPIGLGKPVNPTEDLDLQVTQANKKEKRKKK